MMATASISLPSSSSSSSFASFCNSAFHSSSDGQCALVSPRTPASEIRCSSRSDASIPKLEPFSRNKFDRLFKDPPLIRKSESDLAGDDCYGCWKAYFELKELQKELPEAELEKLILQGGGVKSLIRLLHGVAAICKAKKERAGAVKGGATMKAEPLPDRPFPVPDGLPKTAEDMEEEERGKMVESPYTRLLRAKGRLPAWYSATPDHETD